MNLIKTSRTLAAIAFATLGFVFPAEAAIATFFSTTSNCLGATSASFATSGPTVQVSLCATTTAPAPAAMCGHTILLQSAAGESGRFTVTARALGANYPDANSEVSLTPNAINNPATVADFGGTVATLSPVAAAPNQLLATFDLSPQATATNASYVISLAAASAAAVDADGTCGATVVPTDAPITASFTLNRVLAPTFTSAASTTFALNVANTFNVTASGSGPITFSATGLPGTVGLSSGGVLSGAPTASGSFPVTITATNGSGSAMQSFMLNVASLASQSITFVNPGAQTFSSTPITLSATATSSLSVTFSSNTPNICSVSGATLTMVNLGTCTIAANQPGNASFSAAATVLISFGISGSVPGAPTIGTATPGDGQATISFTAPTSSGGSPITTYSVNCGGILGSGNASPITVKTLTNNTSYTCSVTATNSLGTGPSSGTVNVTPAAGALSVVGVQSRKVHGGAGTFDVPINFAAALTGSVTVEPRAIGGGHSLVFQFTGPITSAGTVSVTDASSATVGAATTAFSGNEITVTMTGIPNNKRVTVALASINGTGVGATASLGFLIGDVNNSRSVTSLDILQVKGRSGQSTDITNFIYDLNASGGVSSTDILLVKGSSGLLIP